MVGVGKKEKKNEQKRPLFLLGKCRLWLSSSSAPLLQNSTFGSVGQKSDDGFALARKLLLGCYCEHLFSRKVMLYKDCHKFTCRR